jgi:hypothetical protein
MIFVIVGVKGTWLYTHQHTSPLAEAGLALKELFG